MNRVKYLYGSAMYTVKQPIKYINQRKGEKTQKLHINQLNRDTDQRKGESKLVINHQLSSTHNESKSVY